MRCGALPALLASLSLVAGTEHLIEGTRLRSMMFRVAPMASASLGSSSDLCLQLYMLVLL